MARACQTLRRTTSRLPVELGFSQKAGFEQAYVLYLSSDDCPFIRDACSDSLRELGIRSPHGAAG